MDPQLRGLMAQTVTVNAASTKRADGSQAFSTAASTYMARVSNINSQERDERGNTVMAAYVAWIDSTGILSAQSKFTLPDGTTPPVVSVTVWPDEHGNYVNKVLFGGQ